MKSRVLILSLVLLSACASHKGEIPTLESQSFNTKIPGESVTINKSCGWLWNRHKCEIQSIEAVGVQPSVAGGGIQQKIVTETACDNAKVNVIKYVYGEDVSNTDNIRTHNKQHENQKDRIKSKTEKGEDVPMSANDADKDTNYSIQEALVDTDIEFVRNQTLTAQGHLNGFAIVKTTVVERKTIMCTIKWSRGDATDLRKVRGLISQG